MIVLNSILKLIEFYIKEKKKYVYITLTDSATPTGVLRRIDWHLHTGKKARLCPGTTASLFIDCCTRGCQGSMQLCASVCVNPIRHVCSESCVISNLLSSQVLCVCQ